MEAHKLKVYSNFMEPQDIKKIIEMETDSSLPSDEEQYERVSAWRKRKELEKSELEKSINNDLADAKMTGINPISRPKHYNIGGIEPVEFMESLNIAEDYYAGNIIKYAARYKNKGRSDDIRKARQYCTMLIALLESR